MRKDTSSNSQLKSFENFIEEHFEHTFFLNESYLSSLNLENFEICLKQLTTCVIIVLEDTHAYWFYRFADAFWKYFSKCSCLTLSLLAKQHIHNIKSYDLTQVGPSKWIIIRNCTLQDIFKKIAHCKENQVSQEKIEILLKELLEFDDCALSSFGLSKSDVLKFCSSRNLPDSCPICREKIKLRQAFHVCKKLKIKINDSENKETQCNVAFCNGGRCQFKIDRLEPTLHLTYHHKLHHYSQCKDESCTFISHTINKKKIQNIIFQEEGVNCLWYKLFFQKIRFQQSHNIIIVRLQEKYFSSFNFPAFLDMVKPSCYAICDHYGARQSCNCSQSVLKTFNFFSSFFTSFENQFKIKSLNSLNKHLESIELRNIEDFLVIFVLKCAQEYSDSKSKIVNQLLSQLSSIKMYFGLKIIIIIPCDFIGDIQQNQMIVNFVPNENKKNI